MDYDKKIEMCKHAVVFLLGGLAGFGLGLAVNSYDNIQKKYKMNLKCVQGELYEEIRTNMYVKSHLECFEQRTF
jgi:hypothetical protein